MKVNQVKCWFLRRGETGVPGENLSVQRNNNNKLNPHMTPSPGIEPGPHWWEASALTTAPSLHPKLKTLQCTERFRVQMSYSLLPVYSSLYFSTTLQRKTLKVSVLPSVDSKPLVRLLDRLMYWRDPKFTCLIIVQYQIFNDAFQYCSKSRFWKFSLLNFTTNKKRGLHILYIYLDTAISL